MSKAISFSKFPEETRPIQASSPSSGKMKHRTVEDLSLKCEVGAKALKKESRIECAKSLGYFAGAAAVTAALTMLAIKVGEVVGIILCTLLFAIIPAPISLLIGLVIAGVAVIGLFHLGNEYAVKPIFDKAFHHIDRSAALKAEALMK